MTHIRVPVPGASPADSQKRETAHSRALPLSLSSSRSRMRRDDHSTCTSFAALHLVTPLQCSSAAAILPPRFCNAAAHAVRVARGSEAPRPPPSGHLCSNQLLVARSAGDGRIVDQANRSWLRPPGPDLPRAKECCELFHKYQKESKSTPNIPNGEQ